MTPVAEDLIRKARVTLEQAEIILKAGVPMVAARQACMAAFHAAQALIHDRDGKVPKTHSGVQQQFARLALTDATLGEDMGRFLSRAYDYKDIADYRTDRAVTVIEAGDVIAKAKDFVTRIESRLK